MTRGQAYRESNWSASFGFVVLIVVIVIVAAEFNRSGSSLNSATQTPSPTTAVSASATLDLLSAKATIEAIQLATQVAAPTFVPGSLTTPTEDMRPMRTPNFPEATPAGAGVIAFHPAIPGNWGRVAINMWVELPADLVVYAGGTDDPAQGALFVLLPVETIDSPEAYLTPVKVGLVEVVDAVGERLVLKTLSGDYTFYFDVPTRQFVDSLTVTSVAPTVTPPASATPVVLPSVNPAPYPARR